MVAIPSVFSLEAAYLDKPTHGVDIRDIIYTDQLIK